MASNQFAVHIVDTIVPIWCYNARKSDDKSAALQRIKWLEYDRDGAAFNFSQDLKIIRLSRIHIISSLM